MGATPNVDYVRLMIAFLNHKSGCEWIMNTNYWPEIIILTLASQEKSDMAKLGYKFISRLIEKTLLISPEFGLKIIYLMLLPIMDAKSSLRLENCPEDFSYHECIKPSLNLLGSIMETLLQTKNVKIFKHFTDISNKHNFEKYLLEICQEVIDEKILFYLVNTLYLLYFFEVLYKVSKVSYLKCDDLSQLLSKSDSLRKNILLKKPLPVYLKLMYRGLKYKQIISGMVPKIIAKDKNFISCREQLLYHQIFPCLFLSMKIFGMDHAFYDTKDDIREQVVQKHCQRIVPVVFNQLFQLKKSLETHCSFKDASLALHYLLKARQYYKRDEANTVVDLLIFCYEDMTSIVIQDSQDGNNFKDKLDYLARLMETILTFIIQFDLSWKDTLETITVMEITLDVLCLPMLTNNVSICL